ncbi:PLP-dependent aminotransferase family protein [Fodinicola acaciae]|uniref:MocR-like pyridoxine biosynthesis transcription factor PdxR n=1 Tax=Fodinicola acaciae TaxID=2681555 RepID=UPI0013D0D61E|nr:PLP-dependent aminotransferase family protein [Fodinicola acaciae]
MARSKQAHDDRSIRAADFLQLDIAQAPAGRMADWLAEQLRRAVSDGRLAVGSRLPATRTLAADLRVSRGVVTEAYQRLIEDGHAAGRGRAGTVVVAAPVAAPPARAPETTSGDIFGKPPGLDIFDAIRATPARIDLSPGLPDLAAFPRAAWSRAERAVLASLSAADFGYGDPHGDPALRLAVSHWLARNRGIRVDPADVVIVAGVTQALALIGQVLRHNGISEVAVEDPCSLGARLHLRHWGIDTPPVAVDAYGLTVTDLRSPAVMVTPAHQFPTGVVLDGRRRRELMRWDGLVIEDDYDAEHRYDRPPVPALRDMMAERVIYAGSMSKLIAPALRIGWVLPPPALFDDFVAAKRVADLGNPVIAQLVLAALMENGELERHLRLLRRRHRGRRDAMVRAIRQHLPDADIHGAAAGLHVMVTFSGGDDTELAAAAARRGVKVHPLSWHRQRPGAPGLVLGYAARTPSDIEEAIAVVGKVR